MSRGQRDEGRTDHDTECVCCYRVRGGRQIDLQTRREQLQNSHTREFGCTNTEASERKSEESEAGFLPLSLVSTVNVYSGALGFKGFTEHFGLR